MEQEGTFTSRDGTPLYTKTWKASAPSNLHLIFLHGFSDHINAYYDLFPTLSKSPYNISVHGFDQRGWGRSVPTKKKSSRGQTGDTPLVLSDIHDFILHATHQIQNDKASQQSDPEIFLMGHSMGGAEALYYLLSSGPSASFKSSTPSPLPLSGLVVESPHIAFPKATQPSHLLVVSGRLASKVLPNWQMVQKLESSAMSRNPRICKDWDDDELCHDTGTLRGLAGLLNRADALHALGSGRKPAELDAKLPCPVFWAHGTGDKVCDFESSKQLYGKVVPSGQAQFSEFKSYEGGYHKIHGEPDGMAEEFAQDVGSWILKIAGMKKAQESNSPVNAPREPTEEISDPTNQNVSAAAATTEDSENVKSRL